MWGHGRAIAAIILVVAALVGVYVYQYTEDLTAQREARVTQLLMTPEYRECILDASTCPQIDNVQVPNYIGIVALVIVLGLAGYLFHSDRMQQQILRELRRADENKESDERLALVMSVLKDDEQKVVRAVMEQPGITQATLRIRTDFSKAKLSSLLKELETRDLIKKEADKKTNRLYIKKKL